MTTTDELAKKAINHARENPNLLKTHIFFEATKEVLILIFLAEIKNFFQYSKFLA